jgi:hypothetical protein
LFAAIVFAPALGYSISNGERVPYSIDSEKRGYSIGNGTPAHEIVYVQEPPTMPTYSISSAAQPYSLTVGEKSKSTVGAKAKGTPRALGSQEIMTAKVLGKGLKMPAWKLVPPKAEEEEPINESAKMEPINESAKMEPINESAKMEPINESSKMEPVSVPVMLSIMGMVKDGNETGLAGWIIDLAASDLTPIANTTSAEDGSYSFDNLTAGDYVLSEEVLEGWIAVSPENGMTNVTLTDADATIDFVNKMATL